ncbi:dentin sialophosphoprotein-like [Notothenia coriiceps]|uniref:Dentin sialophosphoprotein-like n=1 Tax=Notothenia coriiceps TaxID=8208 RepID=A0A6I9PVC2_9TELE|nr:PREDICTED: dentin sialophosphoprotein-like [Notothenia coriiceps]
MYYSVLETTAKPVRAGHSCSPTNPFYIRGYSDHPVAFYKADFHNSNMKQEAAPATPESEPRLPEANSKQSSPTKHPHPQVDDSHNNEAQDSDSHENKAQDSDSHDNEAQDSDSHDNEAQDSDSHDNGAQDSDSHDNGPQDRTDMLPAEPQSRADKNTAEMLDSENGNTTDINDNRTDACDNQDPAKLYGLHSEAATS